jgi:hypothetical protein
MTMGSKLYDRALEWLDKDCIVFITVSPWKNGEGNHDVFGFPFEVSEEGLEDGVSDEEMVAKMVECHGRAEALLSGD